MKYITYHAEITDLGIVGYPLRKPIPVRIYTLPGAHDPWVVDDQVRMKASEHGLDEREAMVRWCWSACWLYMRLCGHPSSRNAFEVHTATVMDDHMWCDRDAPPVPEFWGLCKCRPQWQARGEP